MVGLKGMRGFDGRGHGEVALDGGFLMAGVLTRGGGGGGGGS